MKGVQGKVVEKDSNSCRCESYLSVGKMQSTCGHFQFLHSTRLRSPGLQEPPGRDASVPKAGGEVTQRESSQEQRAFVLPQLTAPI